MSCESELTCSDCASDGKCGDNLLEAGIRQNERAALMKELVAWCEEQKDNTLKDYDESDGGAAGEAVGYMKVIRWAKERMAK